MRLINTKTGDFEEFVDLSTTPPYAILSHTWNQPPVGEQSYQDVVKLQEKYRAASPLAGDVPTEPLPIDPQPEVLEQLGPQMHIQFTPDAPSVPHLSPSMFGLLSSLLISIFARAAHSFLLGSSIPLHSESCSKVKTSGPSTTQRSIWNPDSGLSEKVRKACEIARRDGYRYIWIDSSCIDKTSSSELSEAINSMFTWYGGAQVCYAFLADVPSSDDVRAGDSKFRNSRWFWRAWTLQELIAPRIVVFLSQDWQPLGTKDALADLVQEITYIDRQTLTHEKALAEESVAERMRWAARRRATRIEDEAYSLLGIFGITMPTLYGEGAHAFQRLQEEILQRIPDQSLFAWGDVCLPIPQEPSEILITALAYDSPFAASPESFGLPKGKIIRASDHNLQSLQLPVEEYTPTPYGLRTHLCLVPLHAVAPKLSITGLDEVGALAWYLAILGCQDAGDQGTLLSRLCYIKGGPKSGVESLHVPPRQSGSWTGRGSYDFMFTVSLDDLMRAKNLMQLRTRTIYLPSYEPSTPKRLAEDITTSVFRLSFPEWAQVALQLRGYTVSDLCHATEHPSPNHSHSYSHSLTLFHTSFKIQIHYRHMLIGEVPHAVAIEARVWISSDLADENDLNGVVPDTPAYTSAIWVAVLPWDMNFPLRRVHLVAPTGDEVTLRLGLGLAAASHAHYHVHIEVAPNVLRVTSDSSTRAVPKRLSQQMAMPHEHLKLTMLGSVRRALETHGFSVRFEGPCPLAGVAGSHSYYSLSLFNANSGIAVFIKYFYAFDTNDVRPKRLVVVARITLESSSVTSDGLESYRDGPYITIWRDVGIPSWCLGFQQVTLNTPTGDLLTLRLGLDLAWQSEYYLLVDVDGNGCSTSLQEPDGAYELDEDDYYMLRDPHGSIILTLPEDTKRALLEQGYKVHFEGSHECRPNPCHLTLSYAHLTIDIEYSHHLSTGSDGTQRLTFCACVKNVSRRGSTQDNGQIMAWDAWRPETRYEWGTVMEPEGWQWDLPEKEVKLAVSIGHELAIRLGFYLVWLGEYCLTVEVDPPSSLSRPESPETLETSHPGEDEDEGTGDGEGVQEIVAGEINDQEFAHSARVELEPSHSAG